MKRVTVPFFGSESMIQANGSELNVGTNASACLADWDNDGRKDLILGSGSGDVGVCLWPVVKATSMRPQGHPKAC